MSVSFLCTQCQTLLQYPESSSGSVVYCPRCQQAIIVPGASTVPGMSTVPETNEGSSPEGGPDSPEPPAILVEAPVSAEAGTPELPEKLPEEAGAGQASEPPREESPLEESATLVPLDSRESDDFSVPVLSHLNEEQGVTTITNRKPEDDPFVMKQIADDEFLRRLEMDSRAASGKKGTSGLGPTKPQPPSPPQPPHSDAATAGGLFALPIAPPVVGEEDDETDTDETDAADSLPPADGSRPRILPVFMTVLLVFSGILFAAASGIWLYHELQGDNPNVSDNQRAVPIDGQVFFVQERQKTMPDEGSVILVLPMAAPGTPLVLGNLVPGNITDSDLRRVREKLVPAGGAITSVDSNGLFDFTVSRPGSYHILLVSANVYQKAGAELDEQKSEVAQYLFQPGETLLADRAFFWEVRELDHNNYHLQYSFGSKDGKFLPLPGGESK